MPSSMSGTVIALEAQAKALPGTPRLPGALLGLYAGRGTSGLQKGTSAIAYCLGVRQKALKRSLVMKLGTSMSLRRPDTSDYMRHKAHTIANMVLATAVSVKLCCTHHHYSIPYMLTCNPTMSTRMSTRTVLLCIVGLAASLYESHGW